MRLIEADGKTLLRNHGLPVPDGRLLRGDAVLQRPERTVALKAQILAGGRGKAGLVRLAEPDQAQQVAAQMRAALRARGDEPLLLVEPQVDIAAEYYLAWRVDDVRQAHVLMFSAQGGTEIEHHAASVREYPASPLRAVHPHHLLPFLAQAGVKGRALGAMTRFASELRRVFVASDAELLEINPLVVTPAGDLVALDAKVSLDDCAAVRHGEWRDLPSRALQQAGMTDLERRAAAAGCTFVELHGDVALLTGGAGLGMAILDLVGDAGLKPANFVDAPGGSGVDTFALQAQLVFERAARPEVKAILLYLTLTASSLKGAVTGLLRLLDARKPPKPLVIGLVATGSAEREMSTAEAQAAFAARGHACVTELADAIEALKAVVRA